MSRSRPLIAAFAMALIAPVLAATATSQAASPSSTAAVSSGDLSSVVAPRVRQRAKLLMHPQIADPGKGDRSAAKAKSAMTAQFKPRKKGRPVVLQRKVGRRWDSVSKKRMAGNGRVEFTAPYAKRGNVQTYRVVALRHDGLRPKASKGVSAGKWGDSDFRDDFDGSALNTEFWSHREQVYAPSSRRKCSKGDPRAVKVAGGTVRLSVAVNPDERDLLGPKECDARYVYDGKTVDYGDHSYRINGHLGTQGKAMLGHGYAAARMKFQPQAGQHAAFWMRPVDASNEIDVIEWFGNRSNDNTELTSFVYNNGNTYGGLLRDTRRFGSDWATKFHVFSVEWTRTRYTFRIDGKQTFTTKRGRSEEQHYLILSLLSSDYELAMSRSLPQHMYVDWVRYWES